MALTPEHREKMVAGRKAAHERRMREAADAAVAKVKAGAEPEPVAMPALVHEGAALAPGFVGPEPGPEETAEEMALKQPGDEPPDDFERFLAAQDADIRDILSDMELRVVYEAEQKRAADEKKTAAKKLAVARAQRHARASAGLVGPEAVAAADLRERLSQKVSWTVNMPEAGNSGTLIDAGVRINGILYPHGSTMTGTLSEYISYREIEYRSHENERQFQGRSRMSRLSQTGMRFLNNEGHA